uniref:MFS transporter n=1 Tax=uncultured Sphingomonas sp. TaxID=158754 RepID=UPI0035CB005A
MTKAAALAKHPAPASSWTKGAFGFGAVATGVTETGFNYFLLIFYAQVVGLDAWLVSLATTLSLLVDAFADPIAGYWSDNTRSRWGRRHPFMYAAAVPIAVLYALVWMPPSGLGGGALFAYLVAISIAVRLCFTLYETPSSALLPELSYDYDQRSAIQAVRYFFGWAGGNVLTVLMFVLVFPAFATAAIPNGQFSREAYRSYGLIASGVILVSVLVCAIGTHSRVPLMQPAPPRRRITLRQIVAEMRETLSDRSFGALFAAAMLGAIATGLSASLTFYFSTYFWALTSQQIGIITLGVFASAFIGAAISPLVSRKFGKKRGAMAVGLVAFLGAPLPIVLRLIGLLPGNEDPTIFRLVLVTNTLDTALIICFQTLTAAMIADLVEKAELRTGRRSEGVFFAAITFVRKAVLGLGLIAASAILWLSGFPEGAKAGQVSADTLWRLGAWYVPTVLALWLGMIAVLNSYRLGRDDHETNLRLLAEARAVPL